MEDDLFNRVLNTESIFKDQKSLNQAWVPNEKQKLKCRDEILKKLLLIHRPLIENSGEFSTNTLIIGNGGVGKTLTVRYFGRKFRESALKRDVKVQIEYYDCLQHRSKSAILRSISEKFHYSGGHGYSDNEIVEQILKGLIKRGEALLIILDEAHKIGSEDLLSFLNTSIGFGEKNSRFCIICISRTTDWYRVDNEKISSRIQEKIEFPPYNKEESVEILKYRRSLAFRDGILDDDVVELIADIVVENKNMRMGIDIMRSCGLRVEEQNMRGITADMVLASRDSVSPTFRADIIDRLKMHEKLTLWAVARTLKMSGEPYTIVENAYEMYELLCEEIGEKPHVAMSFRKYVRSLDTYKALQKEYLNPTVEKKGRKMKLQLLDISPSKLDEYFHDSPPKED